jgi:hypothetical protein
MKAPKQGKLIADYATEPNACSVDARYIAVGAIREVGARSHIAPRTSPKHPVCRPHVHKACNNVDGCI